LIESESKQWLSYSRYLKKISTTVPGKFDQAVNNSNADSWAALATSLHQPHLFDPPTSRYLLQLSEEK
jgi:hypothetical protein